MRTCQVPIHSDGHRCPSHEMLKIENFHSFLLWQSSFSSISGWPMRHNSKVLVRLMDNSIYWHLFSQIIWNHDTGAPTCFLPNQGAQSVAQSIVATLKGAQVVPPLPKKNLSLVKSAWIVRVCWHCLQNLLVNHSYILSRMGSQVSQIP